MDRTFREGHRHRDAGRLWAAADQLRANSGLTSAQYSQPVLGLIFLRFAEVRFLAQRAVLEKQAAGGRRGSRVDDPSAYQAEGILYLTPLARFDHLLRLPEGADVGKAVNEAMRDIEANNPQLAGVLPRTYQIFDSTLAKRFATTKRKNIELEQLRAAVRKQLDTLVRANPTRADFLTKFEALIESYNAGSRNIDDLFKDLLALSRSLSEEEQRHVREQLTEEELTVFDLLTRPGPDLAPAERDEVKRVARHLLQRVRGALVLNWRQKAQARAQVKLAIEDALDEGLPRVYTPDLFKNKCAVLFEHVFEQDGESLRSR